MSSQLKAEASRINGAKSHGPVTAEGRAKSSQNSTKHGGAAARGILLKCESAEELEELRATYLTTYAPEGAPETALVEQMAAARWRILRIEQIEAELLDDEMTGGQTIGRAFRALADDSKALALAGRYHSRHQRMHDRAYKTLRELQAARLPKQPEQPRHIDITWSNPEQRQERNRIRAEIAARTCRCQTGEWVDPSDCPVRPLILPNEPDGATNTAVSEATPAPPPSHPDVNAENLQL
jgi:hypothetical protein